MAEESDRRYGADERFYRKYRGATIAGLIIAIIGFIAIASSAQYGDDVALRFGNAVGAMLFFGGAAFFIGWLMTRIFRLSAASGPRGSSSRAEGTDADPASPQRGGAARHSGDQRTYTLHLDQLDRTVRDAANPHWPYGNYVSAVESAARAVNAALQERVGSQAFSETELINKAFSDKLPGPNDARLRFPGDRSLKTWISRMNGARGLGTACFAGIRNVAAHEHGLDWTRDSFEYLVMFSVFMRWVKECEVEKCP